MRSDIVPGGIFPNYELPDHMGKLRKLSELQGDDPLILTLARGHYCPKEHQQHMELAAFYPKIAVAYTQIATIATDDHHTLQEFRASVGASAGVAKGAYVLLDEPDPDLVLVATGSEVHLALQAAQALAKSGTRARVVSMPSWELFAKQPAEYRDALLPLNIPTLAIEAGATLGWYKWVGRTGDIIGLDHFGASAPGEIVMAKMGFNVDNVVDRARRLLHRENAPATAVA